MAFICEVEESDKTPNPERQLSSTSINPFTDFDDFFIPLHSLFSHEDESGLI